MGKRSRKIADKKGWTGEEIGRLIVKNTIHSYIEALKGNQEPEPIFSQAELERMVTNITYDDRMHGILYNRYLSLNHWLGKYVSIENAVYSNTLSEIKSLAIILENFRNIQESLYERSQTPIITTRKKFEEETLALLKSYCKENKNTGYTLADIVAQIIYDTDSKEIENVLNKYKKEKPKEQNYLERHWKDATGNENLDGVEDITKYEIVVDVFLYEMFPHLFGGMETRSKKIIEEEKSAFISDYKELLDVALKEISKTLKINDLTADNLNDKLLTMEEAYKIKAWDLPKNVERTLYMENPRYMNAGVAFFRDDEDSYKVSQFEERYDLIIDRDKTLGIGSLLPSGNDKASEIPDMMKSSQESIVFGYKELLKHDTVIDILAEVLDMAELTIFKQGSKDILKRMEGVSGYIESLEEIINRTYYKDTKEAKERVQALKDVLPPLHLDKYKIPEEEIRTLKIELLADLKVFKEDRDANLNSRLHPVLEGVENE